MLSLTCLKSVEPSLKYKEINYLKEKAKSLARLNAPGQEPAYSFMKKSFLMCRTQGSIEDRKTIARSSHSYIHEHRNKRYQNIKHSLSGHRVDKHSRLFAENGKIFPKASSTWRGQN